MARFLQGARVWFEQLTVRVTACVAVTLVVFGGMTVLINIREGREIIFERMVRRTGDLGSFVADLAAAHVDRRRALELELLVQEATGHHDVEFSEIVDQHGNVLADAGDARRSHPTEPGSTVVAKALATGEKVFVREAAVLNAAIPIRLESKLVGAVHIRMSVDSLDAAVARLTGRHIFWTVVLIGVAIPFSILLMLRATRQIRRVTGAARRVAAGDLQFELEQTAKGEVGELQRAFSHMKTALRDHIAENERLAYTDAVTGLPNRPAFRRAIEHMLEDQGPAPRGAVLFLDLDRFKKVNDTLGHDMGDHLLRLVSTRLQGFLTGYHAPQAPIVARLGGDEFTVLLPDLDSRDGAALLSAQIVELLSEPFILEGQEIIIGASVGITMFPDDGIESDKLLRNADLAMYAAKEGGRQTVRAYSPELEQATVRRLTLEGELRKAIGNKEFEVFYQPKVACCDGRVVGAEALVRWRHPERGLLAPAAFLTIAEEAGLVADLSWQVLERAAEEAKRLSAEGSPIAIAVNISARQLEQLDFADRVSRILDGSRLKPSLLELELTESIAMRYPERVMERITPLKERGVRFAIDDFGTGYSSLSYLTRLPLDTVKIDRSFVRAARDSANDKALVTMILRMAESLNFQTVAEGIESEEDFDFVRAHGASMAQGFLFSPPMPYRDFLVFCDTFRRRAAPEDAERPAREARRA